MLAELGLGINPFARENGHVETKSRLGTAQIALGYNHLTGWCGGHVYGGTLVSYVQVDPVVNSISIEIDGQPVLAWPLLIKQRRLFIYAAPYCVRFRGENLCTSRPFGKFDRG